MNDTQTEPQKQNRKKRYDLNFKRSAVELWLSGGKSAEAVAAELGVSGQTLKVWKQQLNVPPPPTQAQTLEQLQEENRRLRRELTGALRRCDILKKNLGHPLRTQRQRFERIKAMSAEHSIHQLCAAFGVSRSGYQLWAARRPSVRQQADADLLALLRQGHEESRGTYGRPRLLVWLARRGVRCGHTRAWRLLCAAGLSQKRRKKFRPVSLTDSDHDLPVAPNRLLHQPQPSRPDAVWLAGITYVNTDEGWLYVAGVLDRCSRRCIGWAMEETLHTSLPLSALQMALKHRRPPPGLLHHSDRGVQYASGTYRRVLTQAAATCSMSRRGNCYDNAAMESFWSSLKRDLIHRVHFATRAQARAAIFEWIEVFYNRSRLHSALGYQSHVDFETHLN